MSVQNPGIPALVVAGLMGCSSVYPPASGPRIASTASAESAVLVNDNDSHIWILSVDGERNGVPSHGQYRFLPGRHTVRVAYYWSRGYVTWTGHELADYAFDAKAGAALKVMCQYTEQAGYKGTWKFWIGDASTGEVVATEDSGPIVTREATGERGKPFFRRFFHSSRGTDM